MNRKIKEKKINNNDGDNLFVCQHKTHRLSLLLYRCTRPVTTNFSPTKKNRHT